MTSFTFGVRPRLNSALNRKLEAQFAEPLAPEPPEPDVIDLPHYRAVREAIGLEAVKARIETRREHGLPLSVRDVVSVVARHYRVAPSVLTGKRRTAAVVRPRQVAMYLAKQVTQRSLPLIGQQIGGRDHTTVLHAVRKIERLIGEDPELRATVEKLKGAFL